MALVVILGAASEGSRRALLLSGAQIVESDVRDALGRPQTDSDSVLVLHVGPEIHGSVEQAGPFESQAPTSQDRVNALSEVADRALSEAGEALRRALALRPRDQGLLQRLQALYEAAGDSAALVDIAVSIAEATSNPLERARALSRAAEVCAARSHNLGRAVALYEAALADDPASPGAFEAVEATLLDSHDFRGAESAYLRQLDRLAATDRANKKAITLDIQALILRKLVRVREVYLGDPAGALTALRRLVELRPGDVDARAELAARLELHGSPEQAIACLEGSAHIAPANPLTYRALHRMFARSGDTDRDFAACAVLVHLGEAEPDEQSIYRANAPTGVQHANQPLDADAYTFLGGGHHDDALSALLAAIAPAAINLRFEQLQAKGQIPPLDPKDRQDPSTSSIAAVRTLGWVAQLLGVRPPDVYAKKGERVSLRIPVHPEATVILGDAALGSLSTAEQVFLFAYELAYDRETLRVLRAYPTHQEVDALVGAALAIVAPIADLRKSASVEGTNLDSLGLAMRLSGRIDPVQKVRLEAASRAVLSTPMSGGTGPRVAAWMRDVERSACRTALLATGDVTVAARLLSIASRSVGGLTAADRVRDLLALSVGAGYAELRFRLGISHRRSVVPGSVPLARTRDGS